MTKKKKHPPLPLLEDGRILIDSHCHLDMDAYSADLAEIIARASLAGVKKIITVGIDLQSSREAVAIANNHPDIFATVGIHPHHADECTDKVLAEISRLAADTKVVAYGEIGIDTVKNYAPLPDQLHAFESQVRLASSLGLPVIIHNREAHEDIYRILSENGPLPAGGVIHCFTGDARAAEQFLELGYYISIPGVVTFNRTDELQEAVRRIPLHAMLVETDGPFLAPVPKRGKRNEPAYMLYTAQKIAELKGVSLAEVARITTENTVRLFNIGTSDPRG